ncbi:Lrp/AsnC family transcriptional regulator [Bombella sp. TMW 2.2543]|uniref:Lrp/AsnC family transcriptional regulator n=1 Tax=Bombella pluederhausensis TaxID=2967336 RepID=A0ABT3WI87_9PROT|nr:Lrp/AsnC family transcriptional regulator [Bombella pluederhausensis]MCX5618608.1 Lrp/AsnC family transcriptional regulator [Bombella pluederhausensis]
MDHLDWKLLAALHRNGRLTNRELGDTIGLSPSQCSRRRLMLEKAGIIRGYGVTLDTQAMGLSVMAFVQIIIKDHAAGAFERFQALINSIPIIQEAHAVSGDADYILKVVTKDLPSLSAFVTDRLLAHDTIGHVKSYIALRPLKTDSPLPPFMP